MIGRFFWQPRESHAEPVLFEFNLPPGSEKTSGFYFGHKTGKRDRLTRPEIYMHI
jgi:hypothetical protein